jgi:hypothetical protein
MKINNLFILLIFTLSTVQLSGQVNLNQVLGTANSSLGQGLSNDKIISGLREALTTGTNKSASKASAVDGFYRNPLIKIPFPPEARQMEQTLRQIGMSKQVDSFIRTLNRAAEDAAKKAAPIFIKSITSMSITDGLNILRGGNSAATDYLRNSTSPALKAEFKPVVTASLQKVNVTKYWKPLASNYNKMPMVKKMNPDLNEYVTLKAMEGMFKLIAEEEAKIRKDPVATGSSIIQEVFGKR